MNSQYAQQQMRSAQLRFDNLCEPEDPEADSKSRLIEEIEQEAFESFSEFRSVMNCADEDEVALMTLALYKSFHGEDKEASASVHRIVKSIVTRHVLSGEWK